MRTHIVDDRAHALQQLGIIQHRLAYGDTEHAELTGFPDQPCRLSKRTHRNRPVIGSHAPEFVTGYEYRPGAKVRCSECGGAVTVTTPITTVSVTTPTGTTATVTTPITTVTVPIP